MQEPERHSPLQQHAGEAVLVLWPDLAMEERPFVRKSSIRGRSDDTTFVAAFREAFGIEPPRPCRATDIAAATVLWRGPTEWLVVDRSSGTATRPETIGLAATDVSSATTIVRMTGTGVHRTLRKLAGLDLGRLAVSSVVGTRMGRLAVLAHAVAPDSFDLYVARSFARSFFEQLRDAADMAG